MSQEWPRVLSLQGAIVVILPAALSPGGPVGGASVAQLISAVGKIVAGDPRRPPLVLGPDGAAVSVGVDWPQPAGPPGAPGALPPPSLAAGASGPEPEACRAETGPRRLVCPLPPTLGERAFARLSDWRSRTFKLSRFEETTVWLAEQELRANWEISPELQRQLVEIARRRKVSLQPEFRETARAAPCRAASSWRELDEARVAKKHAEAFGFSPAPGLSERIPDLDLIAKACLVTDVGEAIRLRQAGRAPGADAKPLLAELWRALGEPVSVARRAITELATCEAVRASVLGRAADGRLVVGAGASGPAARP